MKTWLLSLLVFATVLSAQAGPNVSVVINTGRGYGGYGRLGCAPAFYGQAYCMPSFYPYAAAFSYWGYPGYYSSGGAYSPFGTTSPLMNYTGDVPVIRVPPPIVTAEPITVHPEVSFGWHK